MLSDADKSKHADYINSLSEKSHEILMGFTGVSLMVEQVRHSARVAPGSKKPHSIKAKREMVKEFDKIFDGAPRSLTPVEVFRGSDQGQYGLYTIGAHVIDWAMSSASLDLNIAQKFAEAKHGDVVKIIIPEGCPFLYVESLSRTKNEHEVLLPWGSVFEIVQTEPYPVLKFVKNDSNAVFSEKRVNESGVDPRALYRQYAKEQQEIRLNKRLARLRKPRVGGRKTRKRPGKKLTLSKMKKTRISKKNKN